MQAALLPSDYYGGSATPGRHQPTAGLPATPLAVGREGQHPGASHVHHVPVGRGGAEEGVREVLFREKWGPLWRNVCAVTGRREGSLWRNVWATMVGAGESLWHDVCATVDLCHKCHNSDLLIARVNLSV